MTTTLFGVPWPVWGGFYLVVAAVYTVVWPRPRRSGALHVRPAWQHVILRWCHALVWLLLALSCFSRLGLRLGEPAANSLAGLALLVYLLFLGTWLIDRVAPR